MLSTAEAESRFEIHGVIGRGMFGQVFEALDRVTGERVAIKQVILGTSGNEEQVLHELDILRECQHPNVVGYRASYCDARRRLLFIVMEYCEGGNLLRFARQRVLTEGHVAYICQQVLSALAYIHARNNIHRDLKCENLLLSHKGEIKLTDFGVSTALNTFSLRNSFIGTLHWMAPEAILEKSYDTRADIWSLGIAVIEMMEGAPARSDLTYSQALATIPKQPPPRLLRNVSPRLAQFVGRCLVKDPAQRPTAAELLKDPFILHVPSHMAADMVALTRANPLLDRIASEGSLAPVEEEDWKDAANRSYLCNQQSPRLDDLTLDELVHASEASEKYHPMQAVHVLIDLVDYYQKNIMSQRILSPGDIQELRERMEQYQAHLDAFIATK